MCVVVALHQPEPGIDLSSIFAEVEARTGIKREAVATMQGISATQWSQQLHGNGNVSLGRVLGLALHPDQDGRRFVVGLFIVAAERLGFSYLDEGFEAALTVVMTLNSKLRMARAALVDREAHERKRA